MFFIVCRYCGQCNVFLCSCLFHHGWRCYSTSACYRPHFVAIHTFPFTLFILPFLSKSVSLKILDNLTLTADPRMMQVYSGVGTSPAVDSVLSRAAAAQSPPGLDYVGTRSEWTQRSFIKYKTLLTDSENISKIKH